MTFPSYYIVSRKLTECQEVAVQHALSITPVYCAIVIHAEDAELARRFSERIVRVDSLRAAVALAEEIAAGTKMPPIVVSEQADLLTAVFTDGASEAVPC